MSTDTAQDCTNRGEHCTVVAPQLSEHPLPQLCPPQLILARKVSGTMAPHSSNLNTNNFVTSENEQCECSKPTAGYVKAGRRCLNPARMAGNKSGLSMSRDLIICN